MDLFDVRETAEKLHVSVDAVWDFIHRRELGHVRVGRRVLVSQDDLSVFIAARRQPATRDPLPAA